jgi:Zn-dependent metalloprotease
MKKVSALLLTVMLCALTFISRPVNSQDVKNQKDEKPTGKVTRRYRGEEGGARPAWVESAHARSLEFLKQRGQGAELLEPAAELNLVGVLEDDLGMTHVRLAQVHEDVPVFATQIITHLDAKGVGKTTGQANEAARRVNTSPGLTAARAIKAAKAALGYEGNLAEQPTAKLVILPNVDGSDGATLTYQVELFIADDTKKHERHQYFVDAHTGGIVWHYDSIPSATGYSLYSGTVSIPTRYSNGAYRMYADGFGACTTRNYSSGSIYQDSDNVWGNGLESFGQTAAVDTHFNVKSTWSYFRDVLGRYGLDGSNRAAHSYVHYGSNVANAFYSDSKLYFGDGDAYTTPFVSTDIVAHEFTHGVTEYAAGLIYSNESGAANEAFSDIFGTAVEFYVGIQPDYMIGENVSPGGMRNMADPLIDHYSERVYIGSSYDNGGVHFNSGIQNKAFYLLAEGGTHPQSGITVTGIGRSLAEGIFYRALDVYVTPSSQLINIRNATVNAAIDLYGYGSAQQTATEQAWCAVGLGACPAPPPPPINNATFVSQSVPTSMVVGQSYSVSVTMNNSGTTTWTSDVYRLGSQNPQDNTLWGGARIYLPAGTTVPPGYDYTFYFTVTAPTTAGSYNFQWGMVQDPGLWFGSFAPNVVINVTPGGPTSPGSNNATFVSQSVPTTMVAGQSYSVSVTMNNSGTTTWTSDVYKLGSQNPQDNTLWGGARIYLPAGTTVPPGSNYTFYFTVTAPSTAGSYNFQWGMVQDPGLWFGSFAPNVVINVTTPQPTCDEIEQMDCQARRGIWDPRTCTCRITCPGCEIP